MMNAVCYKFFASTIIIHVIDELFAGAHLQILTPRNIVGQQQFYYGYNEYGIWENNPLLFKKTIHETLVIVCSS
jgi:hypothetical protein